MKDIIRFDISMPSLSDHLFRLSSKSAIDFFYEKKKQKNN